MRKIEEYRITCHGVQGEQYFQGHGTAFTDWEDCATGIGDTEHEALEDALEQLAQADWDVSGITDEGNKTQTVQGVLELTEEEMQECDCHFYVSVDVK